MNFIFSLPRKMYLFITYLLDSTLLGIFIGIITSAVVNVATSQQVVGVYFDAVVLHGISVICLFILIRIRQNIDEEYAVRKKMKNVSENGEGVIMEDKDIWKMSVDLKDYLRIGLYIICLFGFLYCGIVGIIKINEGIVNANKSNSLKEKVMEENEEKRRQTDLINDSSKPCLNNNRKTSTQILNSFILLAKTNLV